MKILLINGPNLQLLGMREPGIYGGDTLTEIVGRVRSLGTELGAEVLDFQSNHEGDIVDRIGNAKADGFDGIIINPAAYTHTSVAIRDAIAAVALPAVEVHISNVISREDFRHVSYTAPVCIGVIAGFGANSYLLALRALCTHIAKKQEN
jgi:3-dehydroquinate dehydratase-2